MTGGGVCGNMPLLEKQNAVRDYPCVRIGAEVKGGDEGDGGGCKALSLHELAEEAVDSCGRTWR